MLRLCARRALCTASIVASLPIAIGWSTSAHAQEVELSRKRVAELARVAPAARVAEAEAAITGAAVTAAGTFSLENPLISGLGGVRFNPDGSRPFSGVATLSWPVDLGGKRSARVDSAKADHGAAKISAERERREVLLAALLQHALVLRAQQQVTLAKARHDLAARVYSAAEKRRAVGSVPELDVALAAMQEKRDAAALASSIGDHKAERLTLLTLLGVAGTPPVSGDLVPSGDVPSLAVLVRQVEGRVDVRAAAAASAAARARAERERSSRWPTVNLLAQYERDDRANIGLLGLAVPLPILNANRAQVATSAAEVSAANARLALARGASAGKAKELSTRYTTTQAAMDALVPVVATAHRAVTLATRGYELGESDLSSVLLVRRELVESEAALLEARHTHAAVKIEVLVTAGRIPE
ncbi:MAG: TolC family protein [Polyangiaceae bacterium]|nr:TolC family protein [Polyangiaceae bacterium]